MSHSKQNTLLFLSKLDARNDDEQNIIDEMILTIEENPDDYKEITPEKLSELYNDAFSTCIDRAYSDVHEPDFNF